MEKQSGLSADYIKSLLRKAGSRASLFVDIFPLDKLRESLLERDEFKREAFTMIVHFDWHFVTIVKRAKYILYIDTLNMKVNQAIVKFLSHLNLPIFPNRRIIQHESSELCGLMCFLMVMYYDREEQNFTLSFDKKDLIFNDELTMEYITRLLSQ